METVRAVHVEIFHLICLLCFVLVLINTAKIVKLLITSLGKEADHAGCHAAACKTHVPAPPPLPPAPSASCFCLVTLQCSRQPSQNPCSRQHSVISCFETVIENGDGFGEGRIWRARSVEGTSIK